MGDIRKVVPRIGACESIDKMREMLNVLRKWGGM